MARKAKQPVEHIKPIESIPMREVPGLGVKIPDMEEMRRLDQLAAQEAEAKFSPKKTRPKKATSCAFDDCKWPADKDTGWCDEHFNECKECLNRCHKTDKYCMVHRCQLCPKRRKIGGMCTDCARGLGMAQGDHRYNAPAPPDNRAVAEASAEGK